MPLGSRLADLPSYSEILLVTSPTSKVSFEKSEAPSHVASPSPRDRVQGHPPPSPLTDMKLACAMSGFLTEGEVTAAVVSQSFERLINGLNINRFTGRPSLLPEATCKFGSSEYLLLLGGQKYV